MRYVSPPPERSSCRRQPYNRIGAMDDEERFIDAYEARQIFYGTSRSRPAGPAWNVRMSIIRAAETEGLRFKVVGITYIQFAGGPRPAEAKENGVCPDKNSPTS